MDIEEKIKKTLKKRGWTIEILAVKIGMTRAGLSLAMKNNDFKVSKLKEIAANLGVSIQYLLSDTEEGDIIDTRANVVLGNEIDKMQRQLKEAQKEIEYLKTIKKLYEEKERLKNNPDAVSEQKLTNKSKE